MRIEYCAKNQLSIPCPLPHALCYFVDALCCQNQFQFIKRKFEHITEYIFLILTPKIKSMNLKYFTFYFLVATFLLTACNQGSKTQRRTKMNSEKKAVVVPKINADSAYYFVEKQVSFGSRVPGTKAHSVFSCWGVNQLQQSFATGSFS